MTRARRGNGLFALRGGSTFGGGFVFGGFVLGGSLDGSFWGGFFFGGSFGFGLSLTGVALAVVGGSLLSPFFVGGFATGSLLLSFWTTGCSSGSGGNRATIRSQLVAATIPARTSTARARTGPFHQPPFLRRRRAPRGAPSSSLERRSENG